MMQRRSLLGASASMLLTMAGPARANGLDALERFVNELLPVRDSMEMGLSAAQEESAGVEKLREGAELTLKLMADVMAKFEVVQIDPQGEPFDPELHQAMSMMPRDDVPANTVVAVIQKGYTLNGRLVRPAMVMVSQSMVAFTEFRNAFQTLVIFKSVSEAPRATVTL